MYKRLEEISNYAKYLSACAVNQANSGHTGAAIGMADFLTVLYAKHLNFDVNNPTANNRDRFIMSNGHASALLYSLLHISGYKDIKLDDIKKFRQLNSKTAGHPEEEMLEGVDISTGPLGQGLANAVGFALAAKKYNINNKTYVSVGDGCLAEGISHEALEFAGHHKLNNLIVLFDNNKISIDGKTSLYTSTDIKKRMQSYGFNVLECDGHNHKKIDKAITKAKSSKNKPVFIMFKTIIGKNTEYADTSKIHGMALSNEELANLKTKLNIITADFNIPTKIYDMFNEFHQAKQFVAKKIKLNHVSDNLNKALDELKRLSIDDKVTQATRASMGECIDLTAMLEDSFISGSADLTPSNCTKSKTMVDITPNNADGNYIHFGIREHAMAAIANGIMLFNNKENIIAIGTFLAFADYLKPAARMSALMGLPIQYILTHDSIGVGEDGPTHQPIEQLSMLRAMPNSYTFRPCDIVETVEAWQTALSIKNAPSFHILSRQNLPLLRDQHESANKVAAGGYVIYQTANVTPNAIIIATGSEVQIAIKTAKMLEDEGDNIRVVSIPCVELFKQQNAEYQESILPKNITNRLIIEAAASQSLAEFKGLTGKALCLDNFGKSAKADDIYEYFNLNAEFAYNAVKSMI